VWGFGAGRDTAGIDPAARPVHLPFPPGCTPTRCAPRTTGWPWPGRSRWRHLRPSTPGRAVVRGDRPGRAGSRRTTPGRRLPAPSAPHRVRAAAVGPLVIKAARIFRTSGFPAPRTNGICPQIGTCPMWPIRSGLGGWAHPAPEL